MPEFSFINPLTERPQQKTNIYSLRAPGVDETALRRAARMFDLSGVGRRVRLTKDKSSLTLFEGPYAVRLYRLSGALRFVDQTRWQVDDGKSHVELSEDEATEIAARFIKDRELVPFNECKLFKVTHLHVETCEMGTNEGQERIIDAGVVFQRFIDDVPVDGPGGKVVVYIDHEGKVTGCDRVWRQLKSTYRTFPVEELRTPKSAETNLKRYWGRYAFHRIEVQRARFGYFELGRTNLQRYLQPAYIMPLKQIAADERMVMKAIHVAPAAPQPVGRLMPSHKVMAEQPVRTP